MTTIDSKDTLHYLIDFLKTNGYPENSLLVNYMVGKFRADLVVVDPQTHTPLQIFLQAQKNQTENLLQIRNFVNEIQKINPDAIGYIVFPSETEPFFEVSDPNQNKIVRTLAFNFNTQVQKSKNAKETLLNHKKNQAVGNLKWVTLVLVSITGLILLLDVFHVLEITGYRLYLILIIVILVLLPYYETIKFANIELTQKNQKKDKNL